MCGTGRLHQVQRRMPSECVKDKHAKRAATPSLTPSQKACTRYSVGEDGRMLRWGLCLLGYKGSKRLQSIKSMCQKYLLTM